VDALLPSVLPTEGPAVKQRVGNALIHGKARLAGLAPPSGPGITGGDGNTRNELYLWHYFGDPSMQMWGGGAPPFALDVGDIQAQYVQQFTGPPQPDPPPYEVNVTLPLQLAGQTVSLLRNGQVIGKAVIGPDGTAKIPASFGDGAPKPGELEVAVEPEGGTPVRVPVDGVPKRSPKLAISCPGTVGFNDPATTSGSIDPALAGATIELTYRQPDGETFQRTTAANAQGNWSHTIDTGADDPNGGGNGGTWTVTARYGGDSRHTAESVSCTFEEEDG
jgi:hypothetical protein